MSRLTEGALTALLVIVIGIFGAMLLAHWAACQEFDDFCAFTWPDGEDRQ